MNEIELRAIHEKTPHTFQHGGQLPCAQGVRGIGQAINLELRAIQKTPYRHGSLYGVRIG
jgi:hypothetical protein